MTKTILFVAVAIACFCMPFHAQSPSKATGPAAEIIATLTLEAFQAKVQALGYQCTRATNDAGKPDNYFIFRAQGYKVAAFVPAPNVLELDNIFTDVHPSLDTINEWNKNNRFAVAYIGEDKSVILQSSLDLDGGVTADGLATFVNNFRDSVASWAQFVVAHENKAK